MSHLPVGKVFEPDQEIEPITLQEKTSSSLVFSFSYCCSNIEKSRYFRGSRFSVVTSCIWRLPPQYERHWVKIKLSCRNDTITESFFVVLNKIKAILLIPFSRILGLTWRETTYFVQNITAIFQSGGIRWTASELLDAAGDPFLACSLEAEMFRIFHFKNFDVGFGIINSFLWIFNAVIQGLSC